MHVLRLCDICPPHNEWLSRLPTSALYLYAFVDGKDEILYIGKTACLPRRLFQHRWHSEFWNESVEIWLVTFKDKESLMYAERAHIMHHKPQYNYRNW